MNIVQVRHEFTRTPSKRSVTEGIVIHHTASSDVSSQTIHTWHLNWGWIGIGYHFVIRADGTIETGRPMDALGTHARSANERTIGIALTGNFDNGHPTTRQVDSLVWLIKNHIYPVYGTLPITGHKEHVATACPGENFPIEEIRQRTQAQGPRLIINDRLIATPVKVAGGRTWVELLGESGRVWVQVRALSDLLGAELTWDQATETARMTVK